MYSKYFMVDNLEHQEKNDQFVILSDSLKAMKAMKDASVDLIFADEPYNLGKDFGKDIAPVVLKIIKKYQKILYDKDHEFEVKLEELTTEKASLWQRITRKFD